MNKTFESLIKSKIEKFVSDYNNLSRDIFKNGDGKLRHPGEFGSYREKIIGQLLEPFLPTRLAIGSGFIITHKGKISTQCDIIIYDKQNTPIIEDNERRFFPIECVAGVIEVKSKLKKHKLKEALIKLAKIKNLRNDITTNDFIYSTKESHPKVFNTHLNPLDQIATILICEEIDGNIDINKFFKQTYKEFDKSLFHNMVLSLKDGCYMYFDDIQDKATPMIYLQDQKNGLINALVSPCSTGYHKEHILIFLNYFYILISSISILFIEQTLYLGIGRPKQILKEKK